MGSPTAPAVPVDEARGEIKVCPACGEPVIFTTEFRGFEYACVVCEWKGDVFAPKVALATPERAAAYAEHLRQYERERVARTGRPAPYDAPQDVPRPRCKGCDTEAQGYLDHQGKPPHWYMRTIGGKTEFACSRACADGPVLPW